MHFHESCQIDQRHRFYLSVRRILLNSGVKNSEMLIGNQEIQPVMHSHPYEKCVMPPESSLVIDFEAALHGGIRIISDGGSFLSIRIRFGESVSEAIQVSNQDHSRKEELLHLPNGTGMTEYGNTVFRFVELRNMGKEDIWLPNVIGVALEEDIEVTGSFESSDDRLNEIWKTAVRTVHLCMQDYLYDGAKRDRVVWMGDMHPEIHGILCAFSDSSIIRRSFEFLIRRYPADEPMNNIYTYNCWFLIGLWDYFCASGDRDLLYAHRGYIRLMVETLAIFVNLDGVECIPERRFLDWPDDADQAAKHAGIQALLFWAMTAGEKLFLALDIPSDMVLQSKRRLSQHIPDPVGRKAPAALLMLTGLADHTDVLEKDPFRDISTFLGYYVLQAKATLPALTLIREYWGAMLDYGATSFWENFDLAWTQNASRIDEPPEPGKADLHADFGAYCYKGLRHSLSHGWSCGPAPFLSQRVLGVTFPEPGKVRIHPDLGDLNYVRGCVPTPRGLIQVEAEKGKTVRVELPEGLQQIF